MSNSFISAHRWCKVRLRDRKVPNVKSHTQNTPYRLCWLLYFIQSITTHYIHFSNFICSQFYSIPQKSSFSTIKIYPTSFFLRNFSTINSFLIHFHVQYIYGFLSLRVCLPCRSTSSGLRPRVNHISFLSLFFRSHPVHLPLISSTRPLSVSWLLRS